MTAPITNDSKEGILFGMGNPLLDISAEVPTEVLTKYGLEANNAILCEEKHKPIYQELIQHHKVDYVAGGATQNSIRGAQWLLPPGYTTYVGCVGNDEFAHKLEEVARADGVNVQYLKDESTPTGTCAVLITGNNRSLVANLSAANNYKPSHLQSPEIWKYVEKAKFYYISGFFLTVSPESMKLIGKHSAEHHKLFSFNLSAPFIPQFFKDPLNQVLPYVDIIFGNETEATSYAKSHDLPEPHTTSAVALHLLTLPKISSRPRMVVFTQGADPTIVAHEGKITEYPIIPIKKEDIVDTNGAGDAFVGGFLAGLVLNESIDVCVKRGHYTANRVIKRLGPTYPREKPDFKP